MAVTPSTMLALGTPAPDFSLADTQGHTVTLDDVAGAKGLVVMFICNHCPFVKHVAGQLVQVANDYQPRGIGFVAINSNDVANYPDDSPENMKKEKAARAYPFPYLFDDTQQVAQAYTAACTPDFFVFDGDRRLAYRGQLDDTRPTRISSGNYDFTANPATGKDLRAALDALVAGRAPSKDQKPSMGCNIKWKPGNEPTGG